MSIVAWQVLYRDRRKVTRMRECIGDNLATCLRQWGRVWLEQPGVVSLDQVNQSWSVVTGALCGYATKWEKDLESQISGLWVTAGIIAVIHRIDAF